MSSIPETSTWGTGSFTAEILSNTLHIPAYMLITILWLKAFRIEEKKSWSSNINGLILLGLIMFAISDESHQSFVPGRTASLMDFGLDLLGILLGVITLKNLARLTGNLEQK